MTFPSKYGPSLQQQKLCLARHLKAGADTPKRTKDAGIVQCLKYQDWHFCNNFGSISYYILLSIHLLPVPFLQGCYYFQAMGNARQRFLRGNGIEAKCWGYLAGTCHAAARYHFDLLWASPMMAKKEMPEKWKLESCWRSNLEAFWTWKVGSWNRHAEVGDHQR